MAFLSIVCILVGFGNIGRYLQLRLPENNPDVENLKLVSYNVRIFNHFHWEEKDHVRDSILSYLNNENAGVICLQEYLSRENFKQESEGYIKTKLNNTPYHHIEYTTFRDKNSRYGIATFSKYPIVGKGVIPFRNTRNTTMYTDILYHTDTIRIFNLHLQSTQIKKYDSYLMDSLKHFNSHHIDELQKISSTLRQSFKLRSKQVEFIKEVVAQSPYPVILCGDFNDTPVSYTYHQLLGDKTDTFREAGSGFGNTYRGKLPSFRIDYIFSSKMFEAVSFTTKKLQLSDHYPISAVLKKAGS